MRTLQISTNDVEPLVGLPVELGVEYRVLMIEYCPKPKTVTALLEKIGDEMSDGWEDPEKERALVSCTDLRLALLVRDDTVTFVIPRL